VRVGKSRQMHGIHRNTYSELKKYNTNVEQIINTLSWFLAKSV